MAALLFAAGLAIERRAPHASAVRGHASQLGKLALGSLAAVPLIVLAGLAFSERGIGGTVSDRWDELTHEQKTPQNDPGRLIQTGNVRTIYWARAIDVWQQHELAGAGAGSFAQAQLRFRSEPTQGRHAHGYVHQTLADLGLIGLAAEPAGARRLALRKPHDAGTLAPPVRGGMEPRAHRAARARAGGDRLRRALGARLDLVRARRRDHRAVLRRVGGRARPAAAAPGRRPPRTKRRRPRPDSRTARSGGARRSGPRGRVVRGGRAAVARRPGGRRGLDRARAGRLRGRTRRRTPRERHRPALGRAVLRARRDRGCRGSPPAGPEGAAGCRAARAREPGGLAPAR